MKISYNWVQEYLDFTLPQVSELVSKIGAQLGEVKEVTALGAKYEGIIVAKVVSCQKVEGSDHLNVCLIDDGRVAPDVQRNEQGLVQVVCGAANVRTDLMVAWLPPGSTVPSSFQKEPFVLGVRNLCGEASNGMLASPHELAIGDNHDGILEVDEDCAVGASFADVYKLNDFIIDIENKMFTHRPDCFGILGIAREIAGILGYKFNEPQWFLTYASDFQLSGSRLGLSIHNEVLKDVPRFMAVALSGIHIKQSRVLLQTYLNRVGIRPINNIVDATNYYMYLTGQPLHAYDYDKVKALSSGDEASIVIRYPKPAEQLKLLNGKTILPRDEAILISTDTKAIGLGGVMGGADTEVDNNTKNIILESATFNMYSIRKTSMAHGIFSEAVTRFNKGQSPLQNNRVILAAARNICNTSGAQFASDIIDSAAPDLNVDTVVSSVVMVNLGFINSRLATSLSAEEIVGMLGNVGFEVKISSNESSEQLSVFAPFWRTDISLAEDIVEEVGRLYGFDRLPMALPLRSLQPALKNSFMELKAAVRSSLSRAGANEVLTYSFVHGNLIDRASQDKNLAFSLNNALSPDLQYYRLSVLPSLLEKVNPNIRAGYDRFALFEIGKSHIVGSMKKDESDVPNETELLSMVFAADIKAAKAYASPAFYEARRYVLALLDGFGLGGKVKLIPFSADNIDSALSQRIAPYNPSRLAVMMVDDQLLGEIGEFKASVAKAFKLPSYCAGFELDLQVLLTLTSNTQKTYQVISKFPWTEQDICLRVPRDVTYAQVFKIAKDYFRQLPDSEKLQVKISPVDIYSSQDDTSYKQITLRITLASYLKTLTDTEVTTHLDKIADVARTTLSAVKV